MTDASPPDPAVPPGPEPDGAPETVRTPRKRFIFIGLGIGLLIIVLIGLFTSLGTNPSAGGARTGGPVPSFTAPNIGPSGPSRCRCRPTEVGTGRPRCCCSSGPGARAATRSSPLAAAVRRQGHAGGALARIRVLGVDSFDKTSTAQSFIHDAGVTFPVASDPEADITSGSFYFDGDPYAVFVKGDGTISKIVRGAVLTPSSLAADEGALIPSGT